MWSRGWSVGGGLRLFIRECEGLEGGDGGCLGVVWAWFGGLVRWCAYSLAFWSLEAWCMDSVRRTESPTTLTIVRKASMRYRFFHVHMISRTANFRMP